VTRAPGSGIAAVVFDVGGVVTGSPLQAIARCERDRGLPAGAINRAIVAAGEDAAWSRLERGELTLDAFRELFESDCARAGRGERPRAPRSSTTSAATSRRPAPSA